MANLLCAWTLVCSCVADNQRFNQTVWAYGISNIISYHAINRWCSSLLVVIISEGGMIRLEPSLSSNFSIRSFRAYPLIEIRQTVPYRAIRADSISINSILPPSCCALLNSDIFCLNGPCSKSESRHVFSIRVVRGNSVSVNRTLPLLIIVPYCCAYCVSSMSSLVWSGLV